MPGVDADASVGGGFGGGPERGEAFGQGWRIRSCLERFGIGARVELDAIGPQGRQRRNLRRIVVQEDRGPGRQAPWVGYLGLDPCDDGAKRCALGFDVPPVVRRFLIVCVRHQGDLVGAHGLYQVEEGFGGIAFNVKLQVRVSLDEGCKGADVALSDVALVRARVNRQPVGTVFGADPSQGQ